MTTRIQLPRWLVVTIVTYLVGVALWFDFFFWLAVTFAAFLAYLFAFLAVIGVLMKLISPEDW